MSSATTLSDGTPVFTSAEEDFRRMLGLFSRCRSTQPKFGADEPDSNLAHFLEPVQDRGIIVAIVQKHAHIRGSLLLSSAPRNLVSLDLRGNALSGPLDLAALPMTLKTLNLSTNKLSGPLDLSRLPGRMEQLLLSCNHFTGTLDIGRLPVNMKAIEVQSNLLEFITTDSARTSIVGDGATAKRGAREADAGSRSSGDDSDAVSDCSDHDPTVPAGMMPTGFAVEPSPADLSVLPLTMVLLNAEGNPLKQGRNAKPQGRRKTLKVFW